ELGTVAAGSRQNRDRGSLGVATARAGHGDVVAVHRVVGDWRQRVELAVLSVPGVGKLILHNSPVRYQDCGSVLADGDAVWKVAYRNLLYHLLRCRIDHGHTVV